MVRLLFSGIVEVVNENIRKSRRLIIILVSETSGFSWPGNSSEEQVAMCNALIQEGIKVVLLELEEIPDYEKMPESIKFIKQKQGSYAVRDFREVAVYELEILEEGQVPHASPAAARLSSTSCCPRQLCWTLRKATHGGPRASRVVGEAAKGSSVAPVFGHRRPGPHPSLHSPYVWCPSL